jgi:hypothetical protein
MSGRPKGSKNRPKAVWHGLEDSIGKLVHYYSNGCRVGYLEKLRGSTALIRPVAAYKATPPSRVPIDVKNIWPINDPS